jgi:hypothetical protein
MADNSQTQLNVSFIHWRAGGRGRGEHRFLDIRPRTPNSGRDYCASAARFCSSPKCDQFGPDSDWGAGAPTADKRAGWGR